ncbi:MAG: hypothetical protein JWO56_1626 [Acidobacteria bacterium]|nr:hypothetical protein [Acidobacteriota bacterium]
MWRAAVNGRTLTFHLTGINNQNFIMKDDETGSWWQQVTGEAIQGPLKGTKLGTVAQDEVSFDVWRRENPRGRVLRPDPKSKSKYAGADWENVIAKLPTVGPNDKRLPPRTLIVGIETSGAQKAYPMSALKKQSPLVDTIGRTPVVIVVAEDGRSVRAFDRTVDGRVLDLYAKPGASPLTLVDAQSGSEWSFAGLATSGPLAGRTLTKVPFLNDYWFDWKNYHPKTTVYTLGAG